jgi:hypothetical protein
VIHGAMQKVCRSVVLGSLDGLSWSRCDAWMGSKVQKGKKNGLIYWKR